MKRRTLLLTATGIGGTLGVQLAAGQQNDTNDTHDSNETNDPEPSPTPTPTSMDPDDAETPSPTPRDDEGPDDDDSEETPTSTETETPEETRENSGFYLSPDDMEFIGINYDPPGRDHHFPEEEWVEFRNNNGGRRNLKGCTVEDGDGNVYEFDSIAIQDERTVVLHTGQGQDGDEHVYWGRRAPVWDNDGDTIYFYDPDGNLLVEESYSGDCESGYYPCGSDDRQTPASTRTSTGTSTSTPATSTVAESESEPGDSSSGGARPTPSPTRTDTRTATSTEPSNRDALSTTTDATVVSPTPTESEMLTETPTVANTPTREEEQLNRATERDDRALADGSGFDIVGTLATLGGLAAAIAHLLERPDVADEEGGD